MALEDGGTGSGSGGVAATPAVPVGYASPWHDVDADLSAIFAPVPAQWRGGATAVAKAAGASDPGSKARRFSRAMPLVPAICASLLLGALLQEAFASGRARSDAARVPAPVVSPSPSPAVGLEPTSWTDGAPALRPAVQRIAPASAARKIRAPHHQARRPAQWREHPAAVSAMPDCPASRHRTSCERRAVMAADRSLRRAYWNAVDAGVARSRLVSYRDRWSRLRLQLADQPARLIGSYRHLSDVLHRDAAWMGRSSGYGS